GNQFQGISDDWNSGLQNMNWNFTFYGNEFNRLAVCSNGWVSFTNTSGDYSPGGQFPNGGDPENLIAIFFSDLHPQNVGQIWMYTNADAQITVVSWINYPHIGNADARYTFQVILTGNGRILCQYQNNQQVPQNYNLSIGIQNANRNIGLSAFYGAGLGAPQNEYALGFAQRWIIFQGPGIVVDPEELNFGDVYLGQERTITATIMNAGDEDLVITGWSIDDQAFIIPEFPGEDVVLEPLQEVDMDVTFAPPEEGEYEATVSIECNAVNAEEGVFTVRLTGRGVVVPVISVDPLSVEDELYVGGVAHHPITIANQGGSDLNFRISHQIVSQPLMDVQGREFRPVDQAGPRRDAMGDIIAQFNQPQGGGANLYCSPVAWDWENEVMWITGYNNSFVAAWTHDNYQNFREVRRFNVQNPMDGAWWNGILYIHSLAAGQQFQRYDAQGNNLGAINMGFNCYGVAVDHE
ncbi:MAG: choice-of-anchor D domain-containing protein, partial [bacterium]